MSTPQFLYQLVITTLDDDYKRAEPGTILHDLVKTKEECNGLLAKYVEEKFDESPECNLDMVRSWMKDNKDYLDEGDPKDMDDLFTKEAIKYLEDEAEKPKQLFDPKYADFLFTAMDKPEFVMYTQTYDVYKYKVNTNNDNIVGITLVGEEKK